MIRAEIEENLHAVLYGNRSVNRLIMKDGTEFQSDAIIYPEGEDEKMSVVDDEHVDGYFFTIDDIELLEIF